MNIGQFRKILAGGLIWSGLLLSVIFGPAYATAEELSSICRQILGNLANSEYSLKPGEMNPSVIGAQSVTAVLVSLVQLGVPEGLVNQAHESFMRIISKAREDSNGALMATVQAIFDPNYRPYDGIKPVFCLGGGCLLKNRSAESVHTPFNYTIAERSKFNSIDLESNVVRLPEEGRPHLNIGLSRYEFILLDANLAPTELVRKVMRDASNYRVHEILSEWASKNSLLSRIGQANDPIYQQHTSVRDGVLIIDKGLYFLLMKVNQAKVTLAVDRTISPTQAISEIQARSEVVSKLHEMGVTEVAGKKITTETVFELSDGLLQQIEAGIAQIRVEQQIRF